MNYLWPIMIIVSYLYALFTGNIEKVNNSVFASVSDVVNLTMTLLGNMCLWCGIMNIVKNTKIIDILKRILRPLLRWLYPDEKNNEKVMENISINMVSNMLGIGNAATPAGIKAMEEMQKNNKNKTSMTDSMATLIVLNTASIQLVPTTVLAIRSSLNSQNPTEIIIPIWISTIVGTVVGVLANKIVLKFEKSNQVKGSYNIIKRPDTI